jgi:hypothetical protein
MKDTDMKHFWNHNLKYKVIDAYNVKEVDLCVTTFRYDDKDYKTWNLIDPIEGDFVIEKFPFYKGNILSHTIETLEIVADLLLEYYKLDKDNIIIFRSIDNIGDVKYYNREYSYFLGSKKEIDISLDMINFFKKNNIWIYY